MNILVFMFIHLVTSCKILSLSGGGAHGAFQGGVLNMLHEEGKTWDVISGISSGSLNSMMLGVFNKSDQTMGMKLVKHMWNNISQKDVYQWNWNPISDTSLLNNQALNHTVFNILNTYGGVAKREIIIGAVNFNKGSLRLFNKSEFSSVERSCDIVMASSSIPLIFPPRFLDNEFYVDGGTFSNEIIRPAVQYCLNQGYKQKDISIDVVICSPPIKPISNKEIEKYYMFNLASRTYDILSNAESNHELYTHCNNHQIQIPMNIYKPPSNYPGGLLDFNHKDLSTMYKMGYNVKNYTIGKYCF